MKRPELSIVSTFALATTLTLSLGCSKGVQEGPPPSAPQASNSTTPSLNMPPATAPSGQMPTPVASSDPAVASFLGLTGPKPESWTSVQPDNSMQAVKYLIPAVDGSTPASVVAFFLGSGAGGAIQANIDRWAGQVLQDDGSPGVPKVEEFQVNNMPVTMVELAGTYQGMGMPAPEPNQLFMTAIVNAPVGMVFIRLVGPGDTVESNREAFMAFIQGLKAG